MTNWGNVIYVSLVLSFQTCSLLNDFVCGQCSTSCGLGAVWRTLVCSTGSESDCDQTKRPAPARQCYLRPCSTWKVGEWSRVRRHETPLHMLDFSLLNHHILGFTKLIIVGKEKSSCFLMPRWFMCFPSDPVVHQEL